MPELRFKKALQYSVGSTSLNVEKMMKLALFPVFYRLFFGTVTAHEECGTPEPTQEERRRTRSRAKRFFGRDVSEMSRTDFSDFIRLAGQPGRRRRMLQDDDHPVYNLVDVPIVYHYLPNQRDPFEDRDFPFNVTEASMDYATRKMNDAYRIYDRLSKTETQWLSVVRDGPVVVHEDIDFRGDCILRLSDGEIVEELVQRVDEWEFKLHAIFCESARFWGGARQPDSYGPTDPKTNIVRLNKLVAPCFDDEGNFLCDAETPRGEPVLRNKQRAVSLIHEFGHNFGLSHTFNSGDFLCTDIIGRDSFGDDVPDTPVHLEAWVGEGCPGLLPYDKDRDLFDNALRQALNFGDSDSCGGPDFVCGGDTCAAYCDSSGDENCPTCDPDDKSLRISLVSWFLKIDVTASPFDTCRRQEGIDPGTNFMNYVPDVCRHEFTPGQLARMMSETYEGKQYIFCNYADVLDPEYCKDVPCASTSTSPNCE